MEYKDELLNNYRYKEIMEKEIKAKKTEINSVILGFILLLLIYNVLLLYVG